MYYSLSSLFSNERKYDEAVEKAVTSLMRPTNRILRKLMRGHDIGGSKLSNYLQRVKNLASGQCNDFVLRELSMDLFLENIQATLAMNENTYLNKLAYKANKIYEMATLNVIVKQLRIAENVKQL